LGKRADGFHELRTIFQTISLHDELRLRTSRQPGISLTIHEMNRFAGTFSKKSRLSRRRCVAAGTEDSRGVEIELKKTIPAGRG